MYKIISLAVAMLVSSYFLMSKADVVQKVQDERALPPYLRNVSPQAEKWVDSMMNALTPEERVAQLFMIATYSNKNEAEYSLVEQYVRKYKLGGLIMMQGTPQKQAELINRYQNASQVPLMIGFDGEWGLSMRLQNVITYPKQMVLGAIRNDLLIYEMGREFARQMKLVGIHINFAPAVDVNNNPRNPVINDRSFGEDVQNVIKKSIMYMNGLQDEGVLASAKHFPGHGDTEVDSHHDLPIIRHSRERLDSVEFKPFEVMAKNGVGSMMVSHLSMPAVDDTPNLPATLSPKIIQEVMRDEMNYQGLVFTDAMNMKGITRYFPSGEAEVRALLAGNDIMLFSANVPQAIEGVMQAMKSGRLPTELIHQKVRRVLLAKYWLGLHQKPVLNTQNLEEKINTEYAAFIKERLLTEATTLVVDKDELVPIKNLSQNKIAAVYIQGEKNNALENMLNQYAPVDHFYISKKASQAEFQNLEQKLQPYTTVINAHYGLLRSSKSRHGVTDNSMRFLKNMNDKQSTINVFFGIPYVLNYAPQLNTILIGNTDEVESQKAIGQAIFGAIHITGKLPVEAGGFKVNTGEVRAGGLRLQHASPQLFDLPIEKFDKLDQMALESIRSGAMPGCQILVAYKGAVIYDKTFGNHTYSNSSPKVEKTDLYDIASITKVAATAPVLMNMGENGLFDINKKMAHYLPELKGAVRNLSLKDILTHQSGLAAWIPFYKQTLTENKKPNPQIYRNVQSDSFQIEIAKDMYMNIDYADSIYHWIEKEPLKSKTYRYSDLGYYYLKKIIENTYQKGLDEVVDSLVWKRLGGTHTMYNPLAHGVSLNQITPTEEDNFFRMQKVHGHVHDQGAAMLGGIAGHAGLFSHANDLAKYFQMLLNGGTYGGETYFLPQTVKSFTSQVNANNRRALTFDKKVLPNEKGGPACDCVSRASFGHTGFTGTIAWADPEKELIFIFLSNRTYPDSENKKLIRSNLRTDMQQVIYDIIGHH